MEKRFKPDHMHRLDSDKRRELVPPGAVLDIMELKEGDTLLDVGAGIGYFAIPASRLIGPCGRVVAADISGEMLDELKRRAAAAGAAVDAVQSDASRVPLPDAFADRILLAFVLHEVDDRAANLLEMKRLLKPDGSLTIVEWDRVESPMGPPMGERISRGGLVTMVDSAGFEPVQDASINDYQYALVVKKK